MSSKLILAVTLAMTGALLLHVSSGFEKKDLEELKCLDPIPPTDMTIDFAWISSVDTWYYPLASQLDAYLTAHHCLKKPFSEVTDADLETACIQFIWGPTKPKTRFLFAGKDYNFTWSANPDGTFVGKGDTSSLMSIPLTDNKSYLFFYSCWEDGVASWGALTTENKLSDETVKEIEAYAKKLGFKEEHFMPISYDKCKM